MFFCRGEQGLLSEEDLAHLEQASAVATEVTSSIMRLKLEVEEKKRTVSLLQTALVCEPDVLGNESQEPLADVSGCSGFEAQQSFPSVSLVKDSSGGPEAAGCAAVPVAVSAAKICQVLPSLMWLCSYFSSLTPDFSNSPPWQVPD